MELVNIEHDIPLCYVTASSYPEGIMNAHEQLHAQIPPSGSRRYFGLSRPEDDGDIVYRAAAEYLSAGEENDQLSCGMLSIRKGAYASIIVHDYLDNISQIEITFQQLLQHPQLDPHGYCVEWYFNEKDVRCMVRLQPDE